MQLLILLELQVENLSDLPLKMLLQLYWGCGHRIANFGATGRTAQCSAITGIAPALFGSLALYLHILIEPHVKHFIVLPLQVWLQI